MRLQAAALTLLTLSLVLAPQARARPELGFQAGRTFAVGSPVSDAFNQGGFTASGSALWPWEKRFRFGASVFAADFGNEVRAVSLADAGGGPPRVYGTIDFGHRGAWGAAWRVDALGPVFGHGTRSYATGSYGYVRLVRDRVGSSRGARCGVVGSLGLGLERTLNPRHALGLTAGGTWLSDDFTRRYGSAALEWRWHW